MSKFNKLKIRSGQEIDPMKYTNKALIEALKAYTNEGVYKGPISNLTKPGLAKALQKCGQKIKGDVEYKTSPSKGKPRGPTKYHENLKYRRENNIDYYKPDQTGRERLNRMARQWREAHPKHKEYKSKYWLQLQAIAKQNKLNIPNDLKAIKDEYRLRHPLKPKGPPSPYYETYRKYLPDEALMGLSKFDKCIKRCEAREKIRKQIAQKDLTSPYYLAKAARRRNESESPVSFTVNSDTSDSVGDEEVDQQVRDMYYSSYPQDV